MKKMVLNFFSLILFLSFCSNIFSSSNNDNLENYKNEIDEILSELVVKYKVDAEYAKTALYSIKFHNKILKIMANAPERKDTWEQYEKKYLTSKRIEHGIKYYKSNYKDLKEVEEKFGVPAEIIVAFLGVETNYGENTGKIKIIDSLGTLALKHPERHKFFKEQLKNFIVLSYRNGFDYNKMKGSYAGAMGLPQFMPDSYRRLAVDFNNDGVVDLWNSKTDVYASISNFLKKNGWQSSEGIYLTAEIKDKYIKDIFIEGDVKTISISDEKLKKYIVKNNLKSGKKYLILLSKKNRKYKIGYKNFRVIMRYNPSTFYAMVVAKLSERIKLGK